MDTCIYRLWFLAVCPPLIFPSCFDKSKEIVDGKRTSSETRPNAMVPVSVVDTSRCVTFVAQHQVQRCAVPVAFPVPG